MVLAVLAIPESPKYLYAKKRFKEAKETLAGIAKFNRVNDSQRLFEKVKFDTESADIVESFIGNKSEGSYKKVQDAMGETEELTAAPSAGAKEAKVNATIDPSMDLDLHMEGSKSGSQANQEVIQLTGKKGEVCSQPIIRQNFLILMILLSVCSFSLFCINFQMRKVQGSITTNTLASQGAELSAKFVSGFLYFKMGAKLGLSISYVFSMAGSIILIFVM